MLLGTRAPISRRQVAFAAIAVFAAFAVFAVFAAFAASLTLAVVASMRIPHDALKGATGARSPDLGKLPLQFEANIGQTDPSVRFVTRALGGNLFFTPSGVALTLQENSSTHHAAQRPQRPQRPASALYSSVFLDFIGSNPGVEIAETEPLPGRANYFLGNDPGRWRSDVPTYASITYLGLYDGVDLSYRGDAQQLKGTYTVAPGVDPSLIKWRYTGAQDVSVDDEGNLQITLKSEGSWASPDSGGPGSASAITELAPVAWQEIDGQRTNVEARYATGADGTVGFTLGDYDHNYALTIDPYLTYSTFLGGYGSEGGIDITVDAAGNMYVVGGSSSTSFPTRNPIQSIPGEVDVILFKLNADGTDLIFSTYLGGYSYPENSDYGTEVSLDPANNIYITGSTDSPDFPTVNPFQPAFQGYFDAFVAKLDPTGSQLRYSTYLGGSGVDDSFGIAADAAGNAYVTGYSNSDDFPLQNAYQPTRRGLTDAFLTKVSPSGTSLFFSTFFGGNTEDVARGLALDAAGNPTISGYTDSADLPTLNPIQPNYGGGFRDGFITQFNPNGSALLFSTYLGGSGGDDSNHIAIDPLGNIYATGETDSTDFPLANAYQPTYGGGLTDAFVTKLNPDASSFIYSTYLGGARGDTGWGIAGDAAGQAHVAGRTASYSGFPIVNAIQPTFGGSDIDAFVSLFSPAGTALVYSTYLGGNRSEFGSGVDTRNGASYVTGWTTSPDFPIANPLQPAQYGGDDVFVSVISDQPPATPTPTSTGTPPTPTPTACGAQTDYNISVSTGATVVPGTTFVPGSQCGECIATIELPFEVRVYGRTFRTAYANANGYLQFSSRFILDQAQCPPTQSLGYAMMPHWDDLVASCDFDHGIFTSTTGQAPNRVFNIEWRTRLLRNGECADYINFEIRLYEGSPAQQFEYVYRAVPEGGQNAVVGVQMEERSYRRATAFECHLSILSPGEKLTFTLPPCGINTPIPTGTPHTATPSPTCTTGGGLGPWALGQTGPGERRTHAAASDGRSVYVFGGSIRDGFSFRDAQDAWRWDPDTDTWTQLADMPSPRSAVEAAYYDGKIYVMGGYHSGAVRDNAIYDIASNTWSSGAQLPERRWSHTVAAYNGRVYLIGGTDSANPTAIYDIAADTWTTGASIGTGIHSARAVTAGDYIYVSGGSLFEQSFDTVRRYDPGTDTWTAMAPLNTARQGHVVMSDGARIYAINGGNALPIPTPVPQEQTVEIYNVAQNSWTYGNPTVLRTLWSAGGMAGNKLMIYGGDSGNAYLSLTQVATLVTPCATGTPPTATRTSTSGPTRTPTLTVTGTPPSAIPTRTGTPARTPTSAGTSGTAVPSAITTPTACLIAFSDVPPDHTFYPYIRCLACHGIISGYADGTFHPGSNVTRGQLSKIVANAAGFFEPTGGQQYQDVVPGSTFYDYVWRLTDRGYVHGYPCGGPGEPCIEPANLPYFSPNANATRGQISKIVSNAAGFQEPHSEQTFEDVPPGSTFYDFVQRLAGRGVMSGYQCGGSVEPCVPPANRPYFRPANLATRGQTSKIVANTFYPNCYPP